MSYPQKFHHRTSAIPHVCVVGIVTIYALTLFGCASVPPQVAKTYQRELEIIESLRSAHLEMVDSFIDQKLENFERFFFNTYGPVFLNNWIAGFKTLNSRDYDQSRDFPVLYNDLVAEYQTESAPIEKIRTELREAIKREYRNAVEAHKAVGRWIDSLEKLNKAQRKSLDSLLEAIKPGLSLASIDQAIETAKKNVERKITELQ